MLTLDGNGFAQLNVSFSFRICNHSHNVCTFMISFVQRFELCLRFLCAVLGTII